MKEYAVLIDSTYCTACNTCAYRCIQEFRYHTQAAKGLFRTFVAANDEGIYHKRCMHCLEPECVKQCPVNALTKTEYGPVLYSIDTCIGCQICVKVCPFGIPQFDEATKKIVKCSLCAQRVGNGKEPACVEACPTGALQFGEYKAMMAKAKDLAAKRKLTLYGMQEAGGTHLFVLTEGDPVKAGYPAVAKRAVKMKALPADGLVRVPVVAGLVLGGLKKLSDRKESIASEKD
ncbi:MAG: Anaerobic dimethyl sulfoxide reductase chain B [Syntrophorhabdus sp. PtaU1.Bin153]|nr:MAG: Anaerobic dimethyl sulfoxide reductase chain B [Syntrophorhabdus sp. PtaU1.Bin153]